MYNFSILKVMTVCIKAYASLSYFQLQLNGSISCRFCQKYGLSHHAVNNSQFSLAYLIFLFVVFGFPLASRLVFILHIYICSSRTCEKKCHILIGCLFVNLRLTLEPCLGITIVRPCLHGVGDPSLVGQVSFVFTLWRTQNKRNLPHQTGVPHSM